jgi:hypothetical protein
MLQTVSKETVARASCAVLSYQEMKLQFGRSLGTSTQVLEEEKGAMAENLQSQTP